MRQGGIELVRGKNGEGDREGGMERLRGEVTERQQGNIVLKLGQISLIVSLFLLPPSAPPLSFVQLSERDYNLFSI